MMKKLNKKSEPPELKINKESLTRQYCVEGNKAPVWRKKYIIDALFETSYGTCAYCGCKIVNSDAKSTKDIEDIELNKEERDYLDSKEANENNFMHIDHYVPRKKDCAKVVEWENLIPACPKCNILKGGHDVQEYPIVNPFIEDPRCYFDINGCFVRIATQNSDKQKLKALRTLQLFRLAERITRQNWEVCDFINSLLNNASGELGEALKAKGRGDNSKINNLCYRIRELLKKGLPESDYGALIATFILQHPCFEQIKAKLKENGLWSDGMKNLESKLKLIAYVK